MAKGIFSWFSRNKDEKHEEVEQQPEQAAPAPSEPEQEPQGAPQEPVEEPAAVEPEVKEPEVQPPRAEAPQPEPASDDAAEVEPRPQSDVPPQPEAEVQPKTEPQPEPELEPQPKPELESQSEPELESQPELELESQPESELESQPEPELESQPEPEPEAEKGGFFARLKAGLKKTRENIGGGFMALFRGKKIDDELFEELETQLLLADVGVETTSRIIDSLTERAGFGELKDSDALFTHLKQELGTTLDKVNQPLVIDNPDGPFVILMVGVNGVGKTTTIGKLAKQFQAEGKSVMLAAGDTFRAAAVEQLQVWGERNRIPVVAQHTGADSASVIFDALQAAKARGVDVLIADTAGRLQNKAHLMDELKKIVRVMKKLDENAPHEVMLTLDASTGQNAISQAQLFDETVSLTGLTLTKLDGTAKGGVIFALADKFGIPVRYIGVGEGIDDLRPFDSSAFIEALFTEDNE